MNCCTAHFSEPSNLLNDTLNKLEISEDYVWCEEELRTGIQENTVIWLQSIVVIQYWFTISGYKFGPNKHIPDEFLEFPSTAVK